MRRLFCAVLTTGLLICPSFSSGANPMQNDRDGPNGDNVTFYQVPLMCHAAPGIGCGSRSKPVLLDLESKSIVKEAWLDREGKTLAIVWKDGVAAPRRAVAVMAVRKAHDLSAEELGGEARATALASFRAGGG